MKRFNVMMGLVVMGLSSAACVRAQTVEIPNPLVAGAVSENTIHFPDAATEMHFELPPGTLGHEAKMVSMDDQQVCFAVRLRSEGGRRDLASPNGWRLFLRGEPEFEDMTPIIKEVAEPSENVVQGTIERQTHADRQVCDQNGRNCYTDHITVTSREPAPITVVTGGGTVCFRNTGHIVKSTEELTLHMDDPNPTASVDGAAAGMMWAGFSNRVAFRWKFN